MAQETINITHPHLQALDKGAGQNVERVRRLFETHGESVLTWKPDPETWSIAECIEHLVVIDGQYIPKITEAIERAEREGKRSDAPYRAAWLTGMFINASGENGKRKVKTFKAFQPDQAGHAGDVGSAGRFIAQQEMLRALIRRADGLDLNRVKFSSPLSSLLRFSIGEALAMLISHQKRHLTQGERMEGRILNDEL